MKELLQVCVWVWWVQGAVCMGVVCGCGGCKVWYVWVLCVWMWWMQGVVCGCGGCKVWYVGVVCRCDGCRCQVRCGDGVILV